MGELSFLDDIYSHIEKYRSYDKPKNLLNAISDYYYRENFHSDILAFYLEDDLVKREFIEWLNNNIRSERHIDYRKYKDGEINREENRIDILLKSNDGKHAIIIENKSNGAEDQHNQLIRYFNDLKKREIVVDAILYLNKNSLKDPDINEDEKSQIDKILVIAQLVGKNGNSFTHNVIDRVLVKHSNVRVIALSMELKELFNTVVYGDFNMEILGKFADELSKNDNLNKLRKSIIAFNDLPKCFAQKYKSYMEAYLKNRFSNPENPYKVWIYKDSTLVFDVKVLDMSIAVDTTFSVKENQGVIITLFIRNPESPEFAVEILEEIKGCYLEEIKECSGNDFPFSIQPPEGTVYPNGRYGITIKDLLDLKLIENYLKKTIDIIELYKKKKTSEQKISNTSLSI